jgi:hypothetical protein
MFDDERSREEAAQAEIVPLHTTVWEKLDYTAGHIMRHYDILAQKESTNQHARADVILEDGAKLLEGMPATLLLGLENRLGQLRRVYEVLPTLSPTVEWIPDDSQHSGAFKNKEPEKRQKTEKTITYAIAAPATKEHKAQIDKVSKDIVVGEYSSTYYSGMVTPATKSRMLGRIDELIRAIKKARQRANEEEVIKLEIGQKLFDFIHGVKY